MVRSGAYFGPNMAVFSGYATANTQLVGENLNIITRYFKG